MGLKDLLRGLFGSKPFTVEQIDTTIDFVSRPSVDAMIDTLQDELTGIKADKVVVVSGFEKLKSFSGDQFTGYEYLYNSLGYFGWLLKICEYARESRRPQIIVSRFPRHWNPPKIKVVQANFNTNIFASPDGSIGGTVHEIEASAGAQFMKNPNKITINVIDENDGDATLALYFLGVYAASYYREVLASQGCPPRKPLVCRVISGPGDPVLGTAERNRLRSASDPQQQSAILRAASDKLEQFCTSSAQRRETGAFTGGVLLPRFPQNEQLPPGARSTKTARGSIVEELVSNDEATFLAGMRDAVSFAPKGDATGLEAMKEAIRRRSGRSDVRLYEPGLSVRSGSDIIEARSRLLDLAGRKALLDDPYESGSLIAAFVSVSDSQEQRELLQEVFALGGEDQGYVFQLLFNQMRAIAVLAEARRA